MEADHAFRPGRVDIFDVRTRCYMPILQGKNLIGANDGFRPMRYDNASDLEIADSGVDPLLIEDIQMAGRFVQEEILWLAVERACQKESLFLPA